MSDRREAAVDVSLDSFLCSSLPEYIQKYATEEALKEQEEGGGDSSSESSMSDFSEDEAQDMEL